MIVSIPDLCCLSYSVEDGTILVVLVNTSSVGEILDEQQWPTLAACHDQSFYLYKIHCGTKSIDKTSTWAQQKMQLTRASHNSKYREIIQVWTVLTSRRYQCVYMALGLYVIDKGYFSEAFLFKPRGGRSGLNRKPRKKSFI